MSTLFKRLWRAFRDKEYRQTYAEGFSDSKIATQIKVLREQRGWTQQQLAEAAGMKQSRIATLEDVNYSSWSLRTLRRLAEAFDVWLDVEFKEFGAVYAELQDFSRESLVRRSFSEDPIFSETTVPAAVVTTTALPTYSITEEFTITVQTSLTPVSASATGAPFTLTESGLVTTSDVAGIDDTAIGRSRQFLSDRVSHADTTSWREVVAA